MVSWPTHNIFRYSLDDLFASLCSAADSDAERAAAAMIHNQYLDIHSDIHNDPLSMSGTSDPSGSDIECPGTNHGSGRSAHISDSD